MKETNTTAWFQSLEKAFRKTGSNCSSGYFVDFSIVCKRFLF